MTGDDPEKSDAKTSADDIPEIDAEVVDDASARGALFDDDAAPDNDAATAPASDPESATPGHAAGDNAGASAGRSNISPGVLAFAGLTIVAVGAVAFWYMSSGQGDAETIDPQTELSRQSAEADPEIPDANAPAPAAKIDNAPPSRDDMRAATPPAPDRPRTEPPEAGAPTIIGADDLAAIDNTSLQDGAKAAATAPRTEGAPAPDAASTEAGANDDASLDALYAEELPTPSREVGDDNAIQDVDQDASQNTDIAVDADVAPLADDRQGAPLSETDEAPIRVGEAALDAAGAAEEARDPAASDAAVAGPGDATDVAIATESADPATESASDIAQGPGDGADGADGDGGLDAVDHAALDADERAGAEPSELADIGPDNAAMAEAQDTIAALQSELQRELGRADALSERMAALERELADAQTALDAANAAASDRDAALSALRAENMALSAAAQQSPVAAGAVALSAVRVAIDAGAPFLSEFSVLEQTARSDAALDALRPIAATGAPSLAALRARFEDAARDGLTAANRAAAETLGEKYAARAAGLFNIRPATPTDGDAPAAIISRAEYFVEQGDITAAVVELDALPPDGAAAMAAWIGEARTHARANRALEMLEREFADQAKGRGAL